MTTVVATVGTIAGAGTTTVVTALGTALGEQRRRVALVDATDEGSRLADQIDLVGGGDLTDALRRGTTVGDVQAEGPHDLAAFPADPETSWGAVRPDAVDTLYGQLRERFEFVLVDCGSSLPPARAAWLGHADEVVVVTDPDVAETVPETVAVAEAFGVPVRGVVADRVPPKEVGDAIESIAETGQTVLGVLPEDPTVGVAAEAGESVLRTEPDSAIATCAWELGLRFRQSDHEEPVVPAGTVPEPSDASHQDRAGQPAGGNEQDEDSGGTIDGDRRSDNGPGGDSIPEGGRGPSSDRDPDEGEDEASTGASGLGADSRDDETTPDAEPVPAGTEDGRGATREGRQDSPDSPRDAGFETPDPQPVEPEADQRRESEHPQSDLSSGGSDPVDPAGAPADGVAEDPGGTSDSETGDDETAGQTGLAGLGDLGLDGSDRSGKNGGSGGSGKSSRSGGNDGSGGDGENAGSDENEENEGNAEASSTADAGGDERSADGESAALTDEEIESVFQETMQRVTEQREEDADEDES